MRGKAEPRPPLGLRSHTPIVKQPSNIDPARTPSQDEDDWARDTFTEISVDEALSKYTPPKTTPTTG